jgi:signal transduction histidine kinase
MQNAAERMQTLIDDLLTLSRVTTKAQPFVSVNLNQINQEVLSDLEVRIQQCGECVTVSELPTIEADPVQMRQLFQNLISNALKFHRSEEQQVIKVYSQKLESEEMPAGGSPTLEWFQIIVEDNGIGFEEKYLDRIFNVFQRLHTRSEYEGTGMGLAICRKIAERHGGCITGKSTLGQGANFMVTLPKQQRKGENIE